MQSYKQSNLPFYQNNTNNQKKITFIPKNQKNIFK